MSRQCDSLRASTRNVRRSALTFKNYLKTGSCSESPGKRRASCAYGAKRARPRYAEVAHHVGSSPRSTKSRSALRLQLLAIAFNACAGGPASRRCVRLSGGAWSKPRRATLNDRGAKTSPIIALARSGGGATGAMGEAGTRLVQPSAGRGRDVLAERPCIKVLQKLPQGASPSQKLSHGHAGLSFFVFADSGTEEPMPKRHSNNKINQELF